MGFLIVWVSQISLMSCLEESPLQPSLATFDITIKTRIQIITNKDIIYMSLNQKAYSFKIFHVSVKNVTVLSPPTKVTSFLKQSPNVCSAG